MNVKLTIKIFPGLLLFILITLGSPVQLRAQVDDKKKAEQEAAKQKERAR